MLDLIDTEIRYNPTSGDYDCFVNSRYVGSRPTYTAGDTLVRQVAADLIADGLHYTAAEPDPPADEGPPIVIVEAPNPTPPESMRAESPHAPSLSQAIAIGLVGDPNPTCEHCGAAAFVWCNSHMYCRSWWHTGECQPIAILA